MGSSFERVIYYILYIYEHMYIYMYRLFCRYFTSWVGEGFWRESLPNFGSL